MARKAKSFIAIVLVAVTLLTCTGCSVSYSEDNYRRYMQDPTAYMQKELGEDHPLVDILASPLGQMLITALIEEAKKQEEKEKNAALEEQLPEENSPVYNTYRRNEIYFEDCNWNYLKENNGFYRVTGIFSHLFVDAKGKYKDAFRAYIAEFIINNEDRYATLDIPFKEKKSMVLSVIAQIGDQLEGCFDVADILDNAVDIKKELLEGVPIAEFPEKIEKDFEKFLEDAINAARKNNIELEVKLEPSAKLAKTFKKIFKVADRISLGFKVADCIKTINDVWAAQEKAFIFFEIEEILTTIILNTEDQYMRQAAQEVLAELRGGDITDPTELLIREGTEKIIAYVSPTVAAVGGFFDLLLVNTTPLKELDEDYVANATLHIKMACCERLKDYTKYSDENYVYYDTLDEVEVNVYLLHCLQSQLVYTYTLEIKNATIPLFAEQYDFALPENAEKYVVE